ncbi:L-lactate MFS transporter [Robertkochia aurantiaca]|uniref:L-lactate MFS transporter n=1 Tax=Robertkochia aurantiaca TaxID=2873700 RepID=UPI001CCF0E7F|nr:OFA family MFS transporter [Robertkochia sp. 3YJGBD-33]
MKNKTLKNRWLIAASAIGIHLSIGSVYAYSVMTNPVKEIFQVEGSDVKWAFKLAIFFLGLTTTFLGSWTERVGPRKTGITAGILYGSGMLGAALAVYYSWLPLFYLSYGVLGGIGLGLGYIAPVSALVKWFPDRKGLATGMAIMGFGFSALIFGPLMQQLFDTVGIATAFFYLGLLFMVLITGSSLYLAPPPDNFFPGSSETGSDESSAAVQADVSAKAALHSGRFWYLWFMMFINISCGIALISAASPIMQQALRFTPMKAAAMVGVIGVFNGLGRLVWSGLSDYAGRINIFIFFFLFQALAYYFLPKTGAEWLFLALLFTVISMYGAGFALLPAMVGDLFGTKSLGVINGRILSSWALAGIAGPTIYDMIMNKTGSLNITLSIFALLFVVALILAVLMRMNVSKKLSGTGHGEKRSFLNVYSKRSAD